MKPMDADQRRRFDRMLESVLRQMPPLVHQLLESVPLVVEDRPSRQVMREMGIDDERELCGLHSGIPLIERSVEDPPQVPDQVTIYRAGILAAAEDERGRVSREALAEEIRVTIIHELGHHVGFDEDDLEDRGYG